MRNKTRTKIIDAADQLFYEHGYEGTSFADIADAVQISRGNFYYHFKSKDQILDAVISKRLADREAMLKSWEGDGKSPKQCICDFIDILTVNRAQIKRHGCPIGTLTSELAKLDHPAQADAKKLFALFRIWLRHQFQALGRKKDADVLAMHLLARSQGVATLYNAFKDDGFVKQEIARMYEWLDSYC